MSYRIIITQTFLVMSILAFSSIAIGQDTLVIRPGLANGQDCEIRTDMPDTPVGWSPSFCSTSWTVGGESLTIRGLIRFDLSAIPSNSNVIKATLSLCCDPNSTHYQLQSGDNESYLLRVIQHWDQDTVTWNTQPNTTMTDAVFLPTSTSNTQNYPDVDVTMHVRYMVSHPETNFGWKLQLLTEELYRSMEFASSNDNAVQYRPMLTVIYQCQLPVAGFTYTIQHPEIHFTDTSHYAQSWYWTFGDGGSSSLQNPVHIYSQSGNFQVCLRVTDSCGNDSSCHMVNITCIQPQALFTYDYQYPEVHFHDTSVTGYLISRLWDFGDDSTSTEKDPVHVYSFDTLDYIACLTVIDSCGSSIFCDTIFLFLPLVHFSQHYISTCEKLIQFNSNIENANYWRWDFGDGSISDQKDPQHLYPKIGKFKACLTAGNEIGKTTFCDDVEVLPLILHSGHNMAILYPNPSRGIIQLQVSDDVPSGNVKVTSTSGSVVFYQEYSVIDNAQPIEIDLQSAPSGLYYLQFTYGNYSKIFNVVIAR